MIRDRGVRLILLAVTLSGAVSCDSGDGYPVDPADFEKYLTLTVEPAVETVPADGFSRVRLVAQLDSPDNAHRTIVFTTTAGTLLGGTAQGREVAAASDGRAIVELQSPVAAGVARVRASVKSAPEVAREIDVQFGTPNPDDIIRFVEVPPTAEGDGATQYRVTVQTASALFDGQRKVTFRVPEGRFAESNSPTADVPVGPENRTSVHFIAPVRVGSVVLVASVAGFSREFVVNVRPALPDRVVVEAGRFTLAAGVDKETTITARLRRSFGTPTPGLVVSFSATDSLDHPIGMFRNIQPSDATGQASAIYTAGNTLYRGPVRLVATVAENAVKGTSTLQIVDP